MATDRLEKVATELLNALTPCADATGMNGPAFLMLAQEVEKMGVPVLDLTLAEVAVLVEHARQRYNRMEERLRSGVED
jgi:hypothetical protein